MAGWQQTIIVGNVGNDPESKMLPSGQNVTNFNVAVTRKWNDRDSNERKEETTWFRVACYRNLADIASQYVRKGSQVMVVGRVSARAYIDKNQQPAVSLELNADNFQMLGSRADAMGDTGSYSGGSGARQSSNSGPDEEFRNIPF